jgi:hypothetical protein
MDESIVNASVDMKAWYVWESVTSEFAYLFDENVWAMAKKDPVIWSMYCSLNPDEGECPSLDFLRRQLCKRQDEITEEDWLTQNGEMILNLLAHTRAIDLGAQEVAQMVADVHVPLAGRAMEV